MIIAFLITVFRTYSKTALRLRRGRNTEVTVEWPELTSLRKQAFLEIDCTTRQQFSENLPVMREVFFEKLNPKPFSENAVERRHQFSDKPHPRIQLHFSLHSHSDYYCSAFKTLISSSGKYQLEIQLNCMFSGCR